MRTATAYPFLLGVLCVAVLLAACERGLPGPAAGNRWAAEDALQRGWVAHEAGDWRAAEQGYLESVRHDPSFAWGYYRLGVLSANNSRWGAAEAYFWRAIAVDPQFMAPHYEIGVRRAAAGDYDGAVELLRRAVELSPTDPYARLQLGRTYEIRGHMAEAAEQFAAARQLDPNADDILASLPPWHVR